MDQPPKPAAESFWNRDFLLGVVAYLFLFTAVSLFFLLPLALERFHPRQSRVGLIMGVTSVIAIAIRPVFGRMIDRRGGRRLAVAGTLLLLASTPLFHLVRDAGALPFALRALMGLGWGVAMTATISVCSDVAPSQSLARSMGIIGVSGLVANAVGPWLAELLFHRFGPGGMYDAAALLVLAGLGCVLAIRERPRIPQATGAAAAPVPALRGRAALGVLLVIGAMPVFHGAVRGAMVFFIALFGRSAGIPRVSAFFLVFSAAAIVTRFGVADLSDRYGRKRVIIPSAVLISLNLFAMSQVRGPVLFLATAAVGGLGQGLIYPALSTYLIDFLGRANKGLAISLYLSLFDVGMGLGSPLFGWISDLAGYRWMYVVAGLFLLVSTAVFALRAPVTERSDARPLGEPAAVPPTDL